MAIRKFMAVNPTFDDARKGLVNPDHIIRVHFENSDCLLAIVDLFQEAYHFKPVLFSNGLKVDLCE